jgi:hypothetical protein
MFGLATERPDSVALEDEAEATGLIAGPVVSPPHEALGLPVTTGERGDQRRADLDAPADLEPDVGDCTSPAPTPLAMYHRV